MLFTSIIGDSADIIDESSYVENSGVLLDSNEVHEFICNCVVGIFIYHVNIRSISPNYDNFIVKIAQLNNKPDIIVLSEGWLLGKTDKD